MQLKFQSKNNFIEMSIKIHRCCCCNNKPKNNANPTGGASSQWNGVGGGPVGKIFDILGKIKEVIKIVSV